MKRYLLPVFLILAAVSCERMPEITDIDEIGSSVREKVVEYESGTASVDVVSNGAFTGTITTGSDWIRFMDSQEGTIYHGSGDQTIKFWFSANKGIDRTATVVFVKGSNTFELTLIQRGLLDAGLNAAERCVVVDSRGGEAKAKLLSLINPDDMTFNVSYPDSEQTGWINNVTMKNNFVSFIADPNDGAIRYALITVKAKGESDAQIRVVQYDGSHIEDRTIAQVKSMLGEEGALTFDRHYVVKGLTVSDYSEGNGAPIRSVSSDNQDFTLAGRIAYIESAGGEDGLMLEFNDEVNSIVGRYDTLGIDLAGLTLRREDNPVRYSVSDIPLNAIVVAKDGVKRTVKRRSIGQLKDSDLFTEVELTDVEIPIRKGPFAPIHTGRTAIMTACPVVIRDVNGDDMHMMVNITCDWARDGSVMPQGKGTIKGVLVHEACDNYAWDNEEEQRLLEEGRMQDYITGIGYIGDYQIRPSLRKEDINISEGFETGFSKLICEFAYMYSGEVQKDGEKIVDDGTRLVVNFKDNVLYSTYPTDMDPLESTSKLYSTNTSGTITAIKRNRDFTHLGPWIFGGKISDTRNGNGVVDRDGRSAHFCVSSSTATTGIIIDTNGSQWRSDGWSESRFWCCEFSTADITGSHLSVQLGAMHQHDVVGCPRYWAIEWSTDAESWKLLKEYTVPDYIMVGNPRVWQYAGPKYVTATFPSDADIWGKDKVYVRLRPSADIAGTEDSYSGGTIVSTRYSALNYFSVRYN